MIVQSIYNDGLINTFEEFWCQADKNIGNNTNCIRFRYILKPDNLVSRIYNYYNTTKCSYKRHLDCLVLNVKVPNIADGKVLVKLEITRMISCNPLIRMSKQNS